MVNKPIEFSDLKIARIENETHSAIIEKFVNLIGPINNKNIDDVTVFSVEITQFIINNIGYWIKNDKED